MDITKDISVVLGTLNRLKYLKLTIDNIRSELSKNRYEIIVIDGGSTDGTLNWLAKQKDILTIIQHNHGVWRGNKITRRSWGYFMNLGFKAAQGKYICMLSDDCLIVPRSITNGFKLFDNKIKNGERVGAVAFYWRSWPNFQKYWVALTAGKKMFVNHGLFLKSALEDVGYIDEKSYQFYFADGDLCLRLWQKGYRIIDSPKSFIEHFNHANLGLRMKNRTSQVQDMQHFKKRWNSIYPYKESGMIEQDFQDPNQTAEKYWGTHRKLIAKLLSRWN